MSASSAVAATSPVPHTSVGGFSLPSGEGFAVVFADGSVRPGASGDAFSVPLNGPMTGGAALPTGGGYWEVGADGGVFSYGNARFLGSMGATRLNQPVFSMAATKAGNGYWLVARDGGIFSFGAARFYGSAASLPLQQPISGITTSPSGDGYRLVARDGGIFSYGDVSFYGSLPGRGVHVADVVAMASTPTGHGYWIARSNGAVYPFGDARSLGGLEASRCDPVTAIITNPVAQGYRLVTASGTTLPFGDAPGGNKPTGTTRPCGQVTARIEVPATTLASGASMTGYLIIDNDTGAPLRYFAEQTCTAKWGVGLGNAKIPNLPLFTLECGPGPLVFPVGQSQWVAPISATYVAWVPPLNGSCGRCPPPLPPDTYYARLSFTGAGFPTVAPVAIRVTPAHQ